MIAAERAYDWTDEARVVVWPEEPAMPHYHTDLAACVRRAMEVAEGDPGTRKVTIEHASGFIEMDEIRNMARDPSMPAEISDNRVDTASQKP